MASGGLLLLTDVGAGILRVYDDHGRSVRTVAHPGHGPLEFNLPSNVAAVSEGTLLQDRARLLWLDPDLVPVRSYDLKAIPPAPDGTVHMLSQWVVGERLLYVIGDARMPDGSWRSGFFAMSLDDPRNPVFVREVPVEDRQEYDHYLMGDSHVAMLDGRAYFLAMNEEPRILEADGEGSVRWLEAFPDRFSSRPTLPLHTGRTGSEVRSLAYEKARLAVGLYAGAERLFVLSREPASGEAAGTRWTLTRIDPRSDRVERSVVLPTRANHLSVIPGPERWAILEKGRVERLGVQPIPTLLLVPSAWIEGDGFPLGGEVACLPGQGAPEGAKPIEKERPAGRAEPGSAAGVRR